MSPELAFHQTGSAFFWMGFLLITAAGSGALLLGLLVLLQSSTPGLIGRASGALRHRPWISTGLGAGLTVGLVGLASAGRSFPPAAAFSVSVFAGLGLFGLAAASENLGRRIAWISGREGSRASNLAFGWLVLFAAACVPYVGWFLVAPWAVTSGIGSLLVGAMGSKTSVASMESHD
ncbi:MAG TPA: hypothetical protein VFS19_05650 [Planctomycetota bacterium]|nr:hypothetical protein [Planctomycetota bacterium]